jgi:hypothetical protein
LSLECSEAKGSSAVTIGDVGSLTYGLGLQSISSRVQSEWVNSTCHGPNVCSPRCRIFNSITTSPRHATNNDLCEGMLHFLLIVVVPWWGSIACNHTKKVN